MKIIKLTTPWRHPFFKDQLDPRITDFKFEIDNNCEVCDYWVIWGDLPRECEKMSVKCPPLSIIYITDEAHERKQFIQNFLNQFDYVITCRNDLQHKNLIKSHEINVWHLKKTFSEVFNTIKIPKTKLLSVVCSDLTVLSGHKKRYAFVNRLIGHFKDRMDVFGRGFNAIDDKWDALADYKYSIAIENSSIPGYFTEKLSECYLAHTFPIYYGAPDITDYFGSASMLKIDIDDYKSSILLIEKLLEEDPWNQLQDKIINEKLLYLSKYYLFAALSNLIGNLPKQSLDKKFRSINGHETFYRNYKLRKFYNAIKKQLPG